MNEAKRNILTGEILDCGIEVHRHLGPGLLESARIKLSAMENTIVNN